MKLRARTFTYAVGIDGDWTAASDRGGTPIAREEAWTPEHLVLAGLTRCTLQSLRYHAGLRDLEVVSRGSANGIVTKPDPDARYAFTEITLELDVSLEPIPDDVRELLSRAERDCFVSASLRIEPDFRWTVNGQEIR
jgi:organic hydroperoxide reductase OsmC/OhrA